MTGNVNLLGKLMKEILILETREHFDLDQWNSIMEYELLPMLNPTFIMENLDNKDAQEWVVEYIKLLREFLNSITNFLKKKQSVKANAVKEVIINLKLLLNLEKDLDRYAPHLKTSKSLSQKAIRVIQSTDVDITLVGMRNKTYVDDVMLGLQEKIPKEEIAELFHHMK